MQTKHILIIEDNDFMLSLVREILDKSGFKTLTAKTGQDGYRLIREQTVDLIVLDRRLPDLDGNTLLERLKNKDDTKRIPVTMLSSENHQDKILQSLKAGADDYIVKPFNSNVLVKKIQRLLKNAERENYFYVS